MRDKTVEEPKFQNRTKIGPRSRKGVSSSEWKMGNATPKFEFDLPTRWEEVKEYQMKKRRMTQSIKGKKSSEILAIINNALLPQERAWEDIDIQGQNSKK